MKIKNPITDKMTTTRSVKIKVMGKGLNDVHFTPEQKAQIKLETTSNIVQGNQKRALYKDAGVEGKEFENLVNTEDNNGGKHNAVLLGRIKQLGEVKRFKNIENKQVLAQLIKHVPDLDEYSSKVLKMIIDNKKTTLSDEDSREFYDLSDIILNNPDLQGLFKPSDLIETYNTPTEVPNFLQDMSNKSLKLKESQKLFAKSERRLFDTLYKATEPKSVVPLSEIKKMLPDIQLEYNKKAGNNPNQHIQKLGRDKLTEVFPFSDRVESLHESEKRTADLDNENAQISDDYKKMEIEQERIKVLAGKHSHAIEAHKTDIDGLDITAMKTKLLEAKTRSINPKISAGNKAKLDAFIPGFEKKIQDYENSVVEINDNENEIKKLEIEFQNIRKEKERMRKEFDLNILSLNKETILRDGKDELGMSGLGLMKYLAPHGMMANGKPLKHPRKDSNVYKPRNKTHWVQKKAKDTCGRSVFCGGVLSLDEIIKVLTQVRNTGQQVKAIQMLSSLEDSLPKSEYDRIYKMITIA